MSTIIVHPDNLDALRDAISRYCVPGFSDHLKESFPDFYKFIIYGFSAFDIKTNELCPKYSKKWAFPSHPFVEYEPSDERWCRYFGIGHEEDDKESIYIIIMEDKIFSPLSRLSPESDR